MTTATTGIVVTHGRLGEALVEAAERIAGVTGVLVAISNEGAKPGDLLRKVSEALGEGPAIVFVDLAAGSCGFAGRSAVRDRSDVAVVSGVSLPILLEFLFNRERPLVSLVERLVEQGRANITAVFPNGA